LEYRYLNMARSTTGLMAKRKNKIAAEGASGSITIVVEKL